MRDREREQKKMLLLLMLSHETRNLNRETTKSVYNTFKLKLSLRY